MREPLEYLGRWDFLRVVSVGASGAAALLGMAATLFGQSASFHEDTLHGRRAFVLENGRMRLSTLPGGGFIGEVRFLSDDPKKSVNPMRVPHYQTIDPFTYDVAKHGDLYGTGIQRRLMSGYMGHFFVPPVRREFAGGVSPGLRPARGGDRGGMEAGECR